MLDPTAGPRAGAARRKCAAVFHALRIRVLVAGAAAAAAEQAWHAAWHAALCRLRRRCELAAQRDAAWCSLAELADSVRVRRALRRLDGCVAAARLRSVCDAVHARGTLRRWRERHADSCRGSDARARALVVGCARSGLRRMRHACAVLWTRHALHANLVRTARAAAGRWRLLHWHRQYHGERAVEAVHTSRVRAFQLGSRLAAALRTWLAAAEAVRTHRPPAARRRAVAVAAWAPGVTARAFADWVVQHERVGWLALAAAAVSFRVEYFRQLSALRAWRRRGAAAPTSPVEEEMEHLVAGHAAPHRTEAAPTTSHGHASVAQPNPRVEVAQAAPDEVEQVPSESYSYSYSYSYFYGGAGTERVSRAVSSAGRGCPALGGGAGKPSGGPCAQGARTHAPQDGRAQTIGRAAAAADGRTASLRPGSGGGRDGGGNGRGDGGRGGGSGN